MWKLLKNSCDATLNDEEMPAANTEDLRLIHQVNFIEATAESVPQACLSCMILKEFGFQKDLFSKIASFSTLAISILSLCVAYAKVCVKLENIFHNKVELTTQI